MLAAIPLRGAVAVVTCSILAVAACSSDSGDDASSDVAAVTFDTIAGGDPTTDSTDSIPAATDAPTTEPTSEPVPSTSEADTTTPSTTAAPVTAPPSTELTGPLPEPSVGIFEAGTFDQPVDVVERITDLRGYVVEQPGRIVAFDDLSSDVVLDITDLTAAEGERGLLGLTFHPSADLAYVDYTDGSGNTVVAEFAVDPATGVFDRDSQRIVLTVDQPFGNHNGGKVTFGPDGMLYIGLGDGGSADDPNRNALNVGTRLGKILRIDPTPDGDQPFTVPADNPFVDVAGADPTIWSVGLRNPWRFAFDPISGDLWIADVGQNQHEEIDLAPATDGVDAGKGLNFGWSAFEGNEPFNTDQPTDGHTPPVYVYSHAEGGCSVSGGTVYRGQLVPDLYGWYVFGDYCSGTIWGLDPTTIGDDGGPRVIELGQVAGLSAISAGPELELFAVSNSGSVFRFAEAG